MFRGLGRALKGKPKELAILEIVFVAALYLIPALGFPIVPASDNGPTKQTSEEATKVRKVTPESLFVWGARETGHFVDSNHEDLVVLFTIVLAVSTIMLWSQTKRLAEDAEDQSAKMIDAINATLAVAARTADAASAMKAVADETERVRLSNEDAVRQELRAYLSVEPLGVKQLTDEYKAIGQVLVRNVGKLPASNVTVHVVARVSFERDTDFQVSGDSNDVRRVIQPGASMLQGSEIYFQIDQITNPGKEAFVFGVVYYGDGFGGSRRFTRFCHRYATASYDRDWQRSEGKYIFPVEKARYHTHGNEAD